MMRYLWLAGALFVVVNVGCVERRFLVTTEVAGCAPGQDAGAMVSVNGKLEGPSPLDYYYTWYGKYHLTIVKDGYETLQVDQRISTPWYELPGLDFFSENIWPFKVRDVREFHYVLQPVQGVRPEDVLNRGEALRAEGQQVQRLPDSKPQAPKPPPKPAPPPPGPAPDGSTPLGPPRVLPPTVPPGVAPPTLPPGAPPTP